MGLVKTRRLAAKQKQHCAKAGMQPMPTRGNGTWPQPSHLYKSVGKVFYGIRRPTAKFANYERLYMYWIVCDIDSLWNQADGESQYVAGAERRARGDFVFEVVLQGAIRDVYGDGRA